MKQLIAMMVLGAAALLSPSAAQAQDAEEPRTKFYNFDDMLIDGEFKKPDIMKNKAREKAGFKRLVDLKKNFLPKVIETSQEQALQ